MHIYEISFMKRVNLGNYEHEEFSAKASLTESENPAKAFRALVKFIDSEIKGEPIVEEAPVVVPEQTELQFPKSVEGSSETDKPKAKRGRKSKEIQDGKINNEESSKESDSESNKASSESSCEKSDKESSKESIKEVVEQAVKEIVKDAMLAGKNKNVSDPRLIVVYSNKLLQHKQDFLLIISHVYPDFRNDPELVKKIQAASEALNGKEMYDGEGNILGCFEKELLERLK